MTTATPTKRRSFDFGSLFRSNDAIMAIAVVIVISMLLTNLPTFVVDILIVLNLAISIGIILLSMYVTSPMQFTVFPSLLLLVTLFRLGLSVSTARLILLQGDAGKVVDTFGNIVVGGNYIVGIVIFLILLIIQFSVITAGAGRVAEVAARFTLDAMPGKQMAIDADLNAGMIDDAGARKRRKEIQMEADFYGAMDGASKFVKGDSIGSIIVMLVNVLGGFAIGMITKGMSFQDALQRYALLTVGAGLATQIPSLLISSASGLIVTRTASEAPLGADLIGQLGNLNTLIAGAVIIGAMAFVPGMPIFPFLLVSGLLGGAAYYVNSLKKKTVAQQVAVETQVMAKPAIQTPEEMMSLAVVDPMELEVGYGLIPLVDEERADNLLNQISNIRRQIMTELGIVIPVIRIRDNLRLTPQAYRVKIRGEEVAKGELMMDRFLAIPSGEVDKSIRGIQTVEPAFGLPAFWISETEKGRAELVGYTVVTPLAVLSTHITEIIRANSSNLLSRQMAHEMLDHLKQKTPAAVDGLIPERLSLGDLQDVLRNLLKERIPIRDLGGILEVLAKHAGTTRDANILAEAVRQTMALTISNLYRDPKGYLHVFTLSPQLVTVLRGSLVSGEGGLGFQIETDLAQAVLKATGERMEDMAQKGHLPILLCPREIRLAFRRLVEQAFPNLVVLAFSEISSTTRVQAHGMVVVQPTA